MILASFWIIMKTIITDDLYISLLLLPICRSYDFYLLQLKFVNSMIYLLLLQHLFALLLFCIWIFILVIYSKILYRFSWIMVLIGKRHTALTMLRNNFLIIFRIFTSVATSTELIVISFQFLAYYNASILISSSFAHQSSLLSVNKVVMKWN